MVTSPGAPGARRPRSSLRMRAGPRVNSSTSRVSEILPGVIERLQSHAQGGLQADDAERAALELLHLLAAGVRRVVGGDGVHNARRRSRPPPPPRRRASAAAASSCSCCRRAASRRPPATCDAESPRRLPAGPWPWPGPPSRWSGAWRCAPRGIARPVNSASSRSRATITSSAQPGMPRRPSRVDSRPSCMSPPALRFRSSQCWMSRQLEGPGGFQGAAHHARVHHRTAVVGDGHAPAFFMEPISASASPALSLVMEPTGNTLTTAWRLARSTM